MNDAEGFARKLGLSIERDFCALQCPPAGRRRRLLAAVYPRQKKIVLFERNIADHCRGMCSEEVNTLQRNLLRHEIGHYLSWLEKRGKWDPADPAEEAAAERFAAGA